mgnify:CR=1 FL=1
MPEPLIPATGWCVLHLFCKPTPLAARQHRHGLLVLVPAREQKAAEQVLRVGPLQPRAGHRGVENRAAFVQLRFVLREVRNLDAVTHSDFAAGRLELPEDRLEQRRLA